jgi:hypothetical protein
MLCGIRQNDIGTELQVQINDCNEVVIDVSAASSKQIILKKPSGAMLTKDADFVTDGTDGLLSYVTQSGDLDEIGTWKIQSSVSIGGNVWKSSFKSFKVHRNL